MNDKYLTISAITRYLKAKLDLDENLQTVFLKGEISHGGDYNNRIERIIFSGYNYYTLNRL